MKKLKQKTNPIEQTLGTELNEDPYEIIYADPRNEEIHLKILNKAQLNAQMARWFLDLEYNQLLWSDGVYEILEIDSRRSGANYDSFLSIVHPEDRSIKEDAQKALSNSKSPLEITYRLLLNDGRVKWINEICSTDFDQNGKPIRFHGIIHDISRYRVSENKFIEKEENFNALINSLPLGIAYYQNKKIMFVNPAGIKIFGAHGANEIIGRAFTKFIQPDSIKNFQKKINEVVQGMASSTFEEKLIRLNGTAFDAEIIAIYANVNESPAIQLVITDISEQKRIKEALRRSEKKFRLLTINLSDIIWTINSDGIISYVSPFEENMLGEKAETILKNQMPAYLTPNSVSTCLHELEEIKSIVQSGSKMEPRKLFIETIHKDRKTKWLEVTITALYDDTNNFIGFSGTARNIPKLHAKT